MTKCNSDLLSFSRLQGRDVRANFKGGNITSDAGSLLLREIDRHLNLTEQIAGVLPDERNQSQITHSLLSMIRQRVYGLACGYEDLNDHDSMRHDISLQTAVNSTQALASRPTLCRFENSMSSKVLIAVHKIFFAQFVDSFKSAPEELILDFDATDSILHGDQEGKFYHGYYHNYCFLPLHVFCNKHLLVSYLRPSDQDQAKHSWAILSLLVKSFKKVWPDVKLIFRGDSGFCRHKMFDWCETHNVYYITGMARNAVLERELSPTLKETRQNFEMTKEKQRKFISFVYQAKSWKKSRRIVGKAEYTNQGANPRFIVTNLNGDPDDLYDKVYCARGNMENDIKQIQLDLFSDRISCHGWDANQFRLLLSSLSYILIERMRALCLKGTQFAKAQLGTIRLKLFKIGAVIIRNTRRIRFMFSSSYPYKDLFHQLVLNLVPT